MDATSIIHESRPRKSFFASPLLWAALATVGFYSAIPHLPMHRALAERYFCGHPMEYLLAGLFFMGMAILVVKAVGLFSENAALRDNVLDEVTLGENDPPQRARRIERELTQASPGVRFSTLGKRIQDVCDHVRGRNSAQGLNEHLKYLADVAAERLHAGYALVRTITWAVPILGFLGTVIGITLAISNLTPEQLDKSLNNVTGGLGVAFDTTALALALSVVLVFTSFLVERSEQGILSRVEDFGIQRIAPLFPDSPDQHSPLAEAEMQAAKSLVERTDELIKRQTQLWNETLEMTRANWAQTMQAQQSHLDGAMRDGMKATLGDHAEQLAETREEFLTAFRGVSQSLQQSMADSHVAQQDLQESLHAKMSGLWTDCRDDMRELYDRQHSKLEQLTGTIGERIAAWQTQLEAVTATNREQVDELREQREVLLQLSNQEERLAGLQTRLTENLSALQATENFEQTLHSLSAAVHLLTARTRPQAA